MADSKYPQATQLQQRLTEAMIEGRLLVMQVCGDEKGQGTSPETFFCVALEPECYGGITITLRPVSDRSPVEILGEAAAADG
ncbi:hypothetical protein LCGC14_2354210 [marine sediment metagenome]|uniref:Uncharacterized protein n=1 Tax=marine sediment metagenome TaxID=412755 RepID=A0A0F9C8S0_9ZZZZ